MVRIKRPQSVNECLEALRNAKSKADAINDVSKLAFSALTYEKLNEFLPGFENKINQRKEALVKQTTSTVEKNIAFSKAKMFASHFYQVFNFGVQRGEFYDTDRAYYGMNVNDKRRPNIMVDSDLFLWGQNIIDGEEARIADGGKPMCLPSVEKFEEEFNIFKTLYSKQSKLKDIYDISQENVAALLDDAKFLVKDIWMEVEFAFRHDTLASKRRKCREYGIVYATIIISRNTNNLTT